MNMNNILYQIYVISFSLYAMDIDETWYLILILFVTMYAACAVRVIPYLALLF